MKEKICAALGYEVDLQMPISYLDLDSLEYLNFLLELEISFDDAGSFETLDDIANYLQAREVAEFLRDAESIFPLHWKELAVSQDRITLDIDKPRYQAMEDAQMLYLLTARKGERLVGYLMAFLMPHFSLQILWNDGAHGHVLRASRISEWHRSTAFH